MRVSPRLWLLLAAMSLLIPAAASAEPPAAIETMLRQLGRVVEPPTTAMIYLPPQQKEPYEGVKIERDIAYGSAELNKLDVFTPDGAGGPRPVLLFVRGGAFMTGDKHAVGVPFYDNVMLWAASQGMVGVNLNYRLAPDAVMLVRAELDPPVFEQQFSQAKAALCGSRHGCARTLVLSGESHMSEVYSINTEDTQLTDAIADFVKTGK